MSAATPVVDPAPAAAAPDLEKMESQFLDQEFPESEEATEEVKPAAEAAPAVQAPAQPQEDAELEAFLNRPVPATDKYPKIFHGRPMRDMIASIPEQDRYIGQTRTELQTVRDQAIAAQAMARVLSDQLRVLQGGAARVESAAPAADDPMAFYHRHGIKDPMKEFTSNPDLFFARLAKGATADALAEIAPRFEPIERGVAQTEDERNIGSARKAADVAFETIAKEITDPAIRKAARDRFEQVFAANDAALARHVGRLHAAGEADMYKPDIYMKLYRGYEEALGGFSPLVQPSASASLPTGVKPNPPSSARVTASVAASGGKRVSVRQSRIARDMLRESGLPADELEDFTVRVENEIAAGRDKGLVTD